MSFPKYPSYLETRNPWIGKVPEHWNKTIAHSVVKEKYVPNTGTAEKNLLSLSFGRIVSKDINTNDGLLPQSFETYQIVEPQDIVFRPTDLQNDWNSLRSAMVRERGIITSAYIVVRVSNASPSFLSYLFRAYDHCKVFYSMGGGLRQAFKFSDIKRLPIYAPTIEEQVSISSFLDLETSKIDGLVSEQRRLIELLKEKRQAVISHAVTKGLNPNAPMKPSGIQWLGDVPEHWEIGRLNHLVDARKGIAFKADDFIDEGVDVVKASDIKELTIRTPSTFLPKEFVIEYPKAVLHASELVLSTVGSNPDVLNSAVGQLGRVPENLAGSLLNQNTVVFSPNEETLTNHFLYYLIQTTGYRDHLDLHAHGTANQASLNVADMLHFQIPLPEPTEQVEIVDYLDRKMSMMDDLSAEAERAIELLQERRTALISAAVTGKIDVRGFASKEALT
jgi:type I restriction enzyme S subunit